MTDSKNDATPTAPTAPKKKPEKPDVDATIEENEVRGRADASTKGMGVDSCDGSRQDAQLRRLRRDDLLRKLVVAMPLRELSCQESKSQSVVLKGMGRVINKTVSLGTWEIWGLGVEYVCSGDIEAESERIVSVG